MFDQKEGLSLFAEIERLDLEKARMKEKMNRRSQFKNVKSSASCLISEIEAFLYGGCSSRFWMLRKHINSLNREELKKLPFYSWNCITLKLRRRYVDLVIKDDKQMSIFVKFLVYSLYTLNGVKNSARSLLHSLNDLAIEKLKKETGQVWISNSHQEKISATNEHKIFHQISVKYQVMKIRAKISYMALLRCMTV